MTARKDWPNFEYYNFKYIGVIMKYSAEILKLMTYFSGLNRAYGLYQLKNPEIKGDKILGKPSTVTGEVTEGLWYKHLIGEIGLGIVPIKDGNVCSFGAIDIDIYKGIDIQGLLNNMKRTQMPLVLCRSKSGGLHGFCFVSEPVPAILMRQKLLMMSSYLGFGDAEIYPKQQALLSDRGDVGQWINMPYFDFERTTRFALKEDSSPMSLDEFFKEIESKRWTQKEFDAYTLISTPEITDGPPCLQNLLNLGFRDGHRNDGLFNLAIYLKKTNASHFEMALDEYNARFVQPPLPSNDIQSIVKSIKKKEYYYSCNKAPLKGHCNQALCRTRQYGIGMANGRVVLKDLTKYNSMPPIWFINVEEVGRLELMTEDLQSQAKFQRRCMESLSIMPVPVKQEEWQATIQNLMDNVTLIEVSQDSSFKGLLFEYLERFCTSRVQARTLDEILLGKPYADDTYHWFRLSDFYAFLERLRFKEFKIHQISAMIQEADGKHDFIRIKGKGINVWKIPKFTTQDSDHEIPEIVDKNVM